FIRKQRLFPAWIGAFDRPEVGRWIIAIDPIDKDHARLAVAPRGLDYSIQDLARVQSLHDFASPRIDKIVFFSSFYVPHELIGHRNGDVERVQLEWIGFGRDEFFDVRMIDTKD